MRALTRTLVSVTTAVGIAAGGLVTAGTAVAAPAPAQEQAVSGEVGTLAVVNLGLPQAQAKNIQRWLATYWNYNDSIDGYLGTNSWKAFQRCLKTYWGYDGEIDGIVGTETVKALQRLLKTHWGYTGLIDGIAGDGTKGAFRRMANGV
ncbi:peptidoglycan-binding domain-containing protein [Streptomyces shenzhenensis]|uniref:peptidoglycan-binding domain-containing protein n=1 Tax=Streptomyces shenzhenensis TaxID=943815 RepID=UPI003685E5B0